MTDTKIWTEAEIIDHYAELRKKYGADIIKKASRMDNAVQVGKKYRAEIEEK